jgi:hypothetical protein
MFNNEKYPIKPEWTKYYKALEAIRESGIINMWGAAPLLEDLYPELSMEEAKEILCSWISNYDALNDAFGWR